MRFFSDATRKEGLDAKRKLVQNQGTKPTYVTTTRSNTPTGNLQFESVAFDKFEVKTIFKHEKHCEMRIFIQTYSVGSEADEDELMSESDDSNDSWTTSEEFSAEFILRYGGR